MTAEVSEQAGTAIRPDSIVWYERLAWTSVVVGLASAAADPATLARYYNLYPVGYPIMFVGAIAGQLLWIWLIARKRQNWARWISLVAIVIGIPGVFLDIDQRFRHNAGSAIAFHLGYSLLIVAVLLLFRGDARDWFARKQA